MDGNLIHSESSNGIPSQIGSIPVNIGGISHFPTSYPWNGSLDQVRIYNRALSPSVVTALYNLENTPPANSPPVFTSSATASVPENQTFAIDLNASDENGDALTYSIVGGSDQAKFDLNASTGVLTFKSPPDFEANGSASGNNAYSLIVQVSDATADANQSVTINVTDLYETGPNSPPVFTSSAAASVPENQTFAMELNASDPDGDALTYSIAGGVALYSST